MNETRIRHKYFVRNALLKTQHLEELERNVSLRLILANELQGGRWIKYDHVVWSLHEAVSTDCTASNGTINKLLIRNDFDARVVSGYSPVKTE
jgi:hypothetical protein